jgi:ribosome-associated translation inhibitor RaiA
MVMQIDITFRGMPASIPAEMAARRWIERLRRVYADIIKCSVIVEIPHRHQMRDQEFHVRIELVVPDQVISVSHDPGREEARSDLYIAIADAFRAARRQLQQYATIRRREVKHHAGDAA